jgi:flagellin
MRIQTNIAALSAQRNLAVTQSALQTSTTRLSSGFRINRAADDAAGLSIANQMRGDIRSLQTAQRNASQAGSVLQIADGATSTIASILDRMKELATQASSDNVSADARGKLQAEFAQLQAEVDRIAESTKFQGQTLLTGNFGVQFDDTAVASIATLNPAAPADPYVTNVNVSGARASTVYTLAQAGADLTMTVGTQGQAGYLEQTISLTDQAAGESQVINFDKLGISFTYSGAVVTDGSANDFDALTVDTGASAGGTFRIGSGTDQYSEITLSLSGLTTADLGIDAANLSDFAAAELAMDAIEASYSDVNDVIGQIGAATNRLEFASTNLSSIIQNTMAAESTIRDADMAYEMMQFSKQNILAQAGTAMLAQANSLSQSVLQLLR